VNGSQSKMPFTLSSIFLISGVAPNSALSKRVYYVVAEPEEDTWVSMTMTAFANVYPSALKVNDFVFATGKAVWSGSQLHVSKSHRSSAYLSLILSHFQIIPSFISKPIPNFKGNIPLSVAATAVVDTLPSPV
jgi:hypothetical protein